jgi:hypothetical protein
MVGWILPVCDGEISERGSFGLLITSNRMVSGPLEILGKKYFC